VHAERDGHEWRAVAIAAAIFILALLSKEVSIALLPMVAIWALAKRHADPAQARRFGRAALVFAGITAVYLVTRVVVFGSLAKPWPRAPGLAEALPSVPLAFVTYLRLLLVPVGFSVFRPERPVSSVFDVSVLVSTALIAGLGAIVFVAWRRRPEVLLPLAWFVVWLLPVLNFWALNREWMVTDRYLFLPSLALPWILLVLLPRRVVVPAFAVLAVVFVALTLRYAAIFRDEPTFFAAMEKAEPTSSFIQAEKARMLLADGKRGVAEAALRRAVELDPREPDALRSLGDLELGRGDFAGAEAHYRRALAEEPYASKPFKQLALALAHAGHGERAAALMEESARRWPADFEVQLMHAVFLGVAGERERAAQAFAAAGRLRPGDAALAGGLDATLSRLAPKVLPARPPG
jgi:tetratricopeptide (TPR) repeat protein